MRIVRRFPALAALLCAGACIPYATGTTARTTPRGEMEPSASVYFIPGGVERLTVDSAGGSYFGIDSEMRMGLDDRSDLGIRAAGWMGLVLNYKHRVDGRPGDDGPALAYMVGTGIVNAGEHAFLEASLLASGRAATDGAGATPYGGVKAMYVLPLTDDAVSDDPTVGAFAGLRIGTGAFAISPELAVFYDRSALARQRLDRRPLLHLSRRRADAPDLRQPSRAGGAAPAGVSPSVAVRCTRAPAPWVAPGLFA